MLRKLTAGALLAGLVMCSASTSAVAEVHVGQTVTRELGSYQLEANGTTVPVTVRVTDSVRADDAGSGAAATCWIHTRNLTATSLGLTQHEWQHEVHWCFEGGQAAGASVNDGNNIYTASLWTWEDNSDEHAYNMGTYMDVMKQGHYCWNPPTLPCAQNAYPDHRARYKAGGVVELISESVR
jgi:hypothetical protein